MEVDFIVSRSFIWCQKRSIGEPFTIKSRIKCRNVKPIKILNCFLNVVLYSKFREVNTAFAIQKIAEAESSIALQAETQSSQQLLVCDNIDHLQEIFSGSVTSQRVNGTAIKRAFIGPFPFKNFYDAGFRNVAIRNKGVRWQGLLKTSLIP